MQTRKHAHIDFCTTITRECLVQYGETNWSTATFTNRRHSPHLVISNNKCISTSLSQITSCSHFTRLQSWNQPGSLVTAQVFHRIYHIPTDKLQHRSSDLPASRPLPPVLHCY